MFFFLKKKMIIRFCFLIIWKFSLYLENFAKSKPSHPTKDYIIPRSIFNFHNTLKILFAPWKFCKMNALSPSKKLYTAKEIFSNFPFILHPNLVGFVAFFKYVVRNQRFHQSKTLNESLRLVKTWDFWRGIWRNKFGYTLEIKIFHKL